MSLKFHWRKTFRNIEMFLMCKYLFKNELKCTSTNKLSKDESISIFFELKFVWILDRVVHVFTLIFEKKMGSLLNSFRINNFPSKFRRNIKPSAWQDFYSSQILINWCDVLLIYYFFASFLFFLICIPSQLSLLRVVVHPMSTYSSKQALQNFFFLQKW